LIPVEYMLIAIGIAIIYIIYYVFSKDVQLTNNIRAVASAVEDSNRQIYMIEKKLFEIEKKINEEKPRVMNDDEIYQEIERTAFDLLTPLSSQLKELQTNLADLALATDSRITTLEGGIKQISMPASIHGNDDSKITALFKQGRDVDAIAKELHLSKAEVEFVLKINKLR
jgi:uncharacterized protein YoxC